MQLSMFSEEPGSSASSPPAVWPSLDHEAKAELVVALARLIAKATAAQLNLVEEAEVRDE